QAVVGEVAGTVHQVVAGATPEDVGAIELGVERQGPVVLGDGGPEVMTGVMHGPFLDVCGGRVRVELQRRVTIRVRTIQVFRGPARGGAVEEKIARSARGERRVEVGDGAGQVTQLVAR